MASNRMPEVVPSDPTAPHGGETPPVPSLEPQPGSSDVAAAAAPSAAGFDLVLDVKVRLSVELGRAELPIREVVNIGRGSIIELDGAPGAPLDVRVNGVLVGRGEIVVIDEERLGLRFIEVVNSAQRIGHLR
jgi:flagellar motor switch protein FliN